ELIIFDFCLEPTPTMNKLLSLIVTVAALAAPALSHAADPAATAEARVAAFKKMLRTFEPMGTVVRERDPYRKDAFAEQAKTLQMLAREPWPLFVPGTAVGKSRAKPEIWSQPDAFKKEQQGMIVAVDALAASAQAGDIKDIRAKYATLANTCKSCHDSFRAPQR
ncbi:cytochrome c, partial [Rivihabitans pingtungensis]|uniref:c-type cytochrome n=1 Tax=Rivihabitans pingtungensis TaxID=1054498 RepID=UPI002FDAC01E